MYKAFYYKCFYFTKKLGVGSAPSESQVPDSNSSKGLDPDLLIKIKQGSTALPGTYGVNFVTANIS